MLHDAAVAAYLADLAQVDDPIVAEMTALAVETRFPYIGPEVGRLLHLLAVTSGARRVFELGSGFGYSAYWFARAVGPEGTVILTDRSDERLAQARDFLGRAGLGDRIECRQGDALEVLEGMDGTLDIILNDIDKARYPLVVEPAAARLRQGGLLISDNMLWRGQVANPSQVDEATEAVRAMERALYASEAFATTLIPIRDGVTVSVRR